MFYLSYDIRYQVNSDKPFEDLEKGDYYWIGGTSYEGLVKGREGSLKWSFKFSRGSRPYPRVLFEIEGNKPQIMNMHIQAGDGHILLLIFLVVFSLVVLSFIILGESNSFIFILPLFFIDLTSYFFLSLLMNLEKSSIERDFIKEFNLNKLSEKGSFKIKLH